MGYPTEKSKSASTTPSRGVTSKLDLTKASPDHSTICRFRLELVEKGLMEKLFKLFNKQLQKHGIMTIKEGAIVDASIVAKYAIEKVIELRYLIRNEK